MSRRKLAISFMIPALVASCSNANNSFREGIIVYEDRQSDRKDSSTSLVVEPKAGMMFEYDRETVDYSIRQETEFGEMFKPRFDGEYFFDDANRIVIPAVINRLNWERFGYVCHGKRQSGTSGSPSFAIKCVSSAQPEWFSDFTFDPERGVTSMVRQCPAFKPKVGCRFTLVSAEGIFSADMRNSTAGSQ